MKANINSEMVRYLNLARQYPAFFVSLLDRQLAEFINER